MCIYYKIQLFTKERKNRKEIKGNKNVKEKPFLYFSRRGRNKLIPNTLYAVTVRQIGT